MPPNYNSTALFYDRLSRLLFGNALIEAQVYLLKYIPPGAKIIIIGGGTGWILDEITKLHPSGLSITYVEIAEKMMDKAMKRFVGENRIDFVTDDVQNLPAITTYDVVITPFLFDNFLQQNAEKLFDHVHTIIKSGGIWLYCDFQLTGKWWQKMLLKTMLVFFGIMCNVEAKKLPDVLKLFKAYGCIPIGHKTFFADFVVSTAYHQNSKSYID